MDDGVCAAGHSRRLVRQQRHTRSDWDEVIDDMISEHDMAEPHADERRRMLDYLVRHFGRRLPR